MSENRIINHLFKNPKHFESTITRSIISKMENIHADKYPHPRTLDDFLMCEKLLDAFPDWRARIADMKDASPKWSDLVESWDEIQSLIKDCDTFHAERRIREITKD